MDKQKVRVGGMVRSYDFHGILDYFVEGKVVGIIDAPDCPRYRIKVMRTVEGGVDVDNIANYVHPPVNGTPTTTGRLTNLVVVMNEEQTEQLEVVPPSVGY